MAHMSAVINGGAESGHVILYSESRLFSRPQIRVRHDGSKVVRKRFQIGSKTVPEWFQGGSKRVQSRFENARKRYQNDTKMAHMSAVINGGAESGHVILYSEPRLFSRPPPPKSMLGNVELRTDDTNIEYGGGGSLT